MKLQLDTTVQIHRILYPPNDPTNSELNKLIEQADSIEATTYVKKEYAFSVIKDCCTMLARLIRSMSLCDSLQFIHRYGSFKKRFQGRMLAVVYKFFISKTIQLELGKYNEMERDRALANEFARFLRVIIPELWERFEEGLSAPLQDRTKCPFALNSPKDNGKTFELKSKRKCDRLCGCALNKLIRGEHSRALKLLDRLRNLKADEKTDELDKIRVVLESFFEKDNEEICFKMCNQGIGDLIIAIETLPDRMLITTNAKESNIISPAIGQEHVVLPVAGYA